MLYLNYYLKMDCKTKKSGQIFPIFGIILVLHHKNTDFHMTNFQYIDFVWFISSKSCDIINKKWFPIKRKERKSTGNAEKHIKCIHCHNFIIIVIYLIFYSGKTSMAKNNIYK